MNTDYLGGKFGHKTWQNKWREAFCCRGLGALADCQVYLAISVALSCPFYVLRGMSAAITLLGNPHIFTGGRHEGQTVREGSPGQTGGKVFTTGGLSADTHLHRGERAGVRTEVNGVPTCHVVGCLTLTTHNTHHNKPGTRSQHFYEPTLNSHGLVGSGCFLE